MISEVTHENKNKVFALFQTILRADEQEVDMGKGANVQDLLNILCDSPVKRERMFE